MPLALSSPQAEKNFSQDPTTIPRCVAQWRMQNMLVCIPVKTNVTLPKDFGDTILCELPNVMSFAPSVMSFAFYVKEDWPAIGGIVVKAGISHLPVPTPTLHAT
jgi:hypothetical protein